MLFVLVLVLLSLNAVQAEPTREETERLAGVNAMEVPRDRLLPPRYKFDAPSYEEVVHYFETCHEIAEVTYKGGGYWDTPGEYRSNIRQTSNRVLGYLAGYRALGREIYKQRALEGLEYLLKMQSADGDFPWFNNSYRGIYNRDDGLFEAGIAGRAFIEGYKLTRDKRFLDASRKVAQWEIDCPISQNNNYNMFAVWHLVDHYRITRSKAALESAIEKTRLGGMPEQMPYGGWPGHNSWLWYHGIIVRGMADLCSVLPDDHPFKPELKASLTAALNRALHEQQASGAIPPNEGVTSRVNTHFMHQALIMSRGMFGSELDNSIHGLMGLLIRSRADDADIRAYEKAWKEYDAARESARRTVTDKVVWRADLSKTSTDPVWGEMSEGAINCWYPMNDFEPGRQVWRKTVSERTGSDAREISSRGVRLFGGMGWIIPQGTLVPGKYYRFTASAKCTGTPETMPILVASSYSGTKRDGWDPASGCLLGRENPTFDSFSEVSIPFTASKDMNSVYVWTMGKEIAENASVSLIVDEARITDEGEPLPNWNPRVQPYNQPQDMVLLPVGLYLEAMFPARRSGSPVSSPQRLP